LFVYLLIGLPLCLFVFLSVCTFARFFSLPVCLFDCLSVCLFVCLSIYLPACPSACLSANLPAYMPTCLSLCLPEILLVCLSVYSSACPFVFLCELPVVGWRPVWRFLMLLTWLTFGCGCSELGPYWTSGMASRLQPILFIHIKKPPRKKGS
jgi:hypothetical protein